MKLKSFGCSFIYGTDLADDGRGFMAATPSQLTWPALLAQFQGVEYECYARPGIGNLQIMSSILSHVGLNDPAKFVINWTWIDRFDYTIEPTRPTVRSEYIDNEAWQTVMPIDTDQRATNYYRDLHSQYRDKLTSLVYIKTAVDSLKEKNIPFIMTYMDRILFETRWQCPGAVKYLQDSIVPYMTQFEDKTFLEFSKEKGFPISETLHPLEPAHSAAFELIKSYNLV
jgi:hypothetical protein